MPAPHGEAPGHQPEPVPGLNFNVGEYLRVLRKRLWTIVVMFLVCVGAAGLYGVRQPKIYAASASIIIDLAPPEVLGGVKEVVQLGASDYWSNKEFLETQYKVIASREVLQRVVEKKGLDRDPTFLGVDRISDEAARAAAIASADPVSMLQARVKVDPIRSSQIVNVVVEDTDPRRATELADAIVDAYIANNLDRRLDGTRAAALWLAEQMADLKDKLESSELALYNFKKGQDILTTSLEDRQNITSQRLIALNDSLNRVITQRVEVEAALAEMEQARQVRPDDPLWGVTVSAIAKDATIAPLRAEYVKQQLEVTSISERYLGKHPQRVAAEERLTELRGHIAKEMDNQAEALRSQHREVLATEKQLHTLIEGVKREAFEINKKEIDFKKLKREENNNQRLYELVLSRLKDSDLTALLQANNVRRLDSAQVPGVPIRPRWTLILALGIIGGLLLGFGAANVLILLDNTIKNEEDVERTLGVPFLGMVPSLEISARHHRVSHADDVERDQYVFQHPKSAAAECCRAIRTNLLFMSTQRDLRRIVVTSSGPQEGKTTTCINVGVTMALNGAKVLLVDTDMRRPRLHRAFKVSNDVGLSTLVVGEASLEDALKSTAIPNLSVLPCGPVPPNPAELLHTEKFQQILATLGERFDRIVFDTPPLIAVADAAVLSQSADGVLLVARFAKTTKFIATRALRTLRDVKATVLGVVMNDVNLKSREYDYYYYRRYGYYYSEGGESAKAQSS